MVYLSLFGKKDVHVKSLETAQFMVNNVNKDQSWEWQVKGNENEYCIIWGRF